MAASANRFLALGRRLRAHLPAPAVRVLVRGLNASRRWRRATRGGIRRQINGRSGRGHGTVTVVVTAHNDARFLDDCLSSVRSQSYTDWRCIVVDDASSDESVAVASRHSHEDDRVQVVCHRQNAGLSASRNTGLMRASTPWVCFLDADDFLLRSSLADRVALLASAAERRDVAGVFCGAVTVAEDVRPSEFPPRLDGEVREYEDLLTTAGGCPFPAHAPLLRTGVLVAAGGFDESMRDGAEDWDAWLRLMRSGYQFLGVQARLVAYRMKRASMVGSDPAAHLTVGRALLESVHAPADRARLVPGGPGPLLRPLADVILRLEHARRILSFAPLVAVDDLDGARGLVAEVDAPTWLLLSRREDIGARLAASARRAQQTHPTATVDADGLAARVGEWIDSARRPPQTEDSPQTDPGELVIASNSADVLALIDTHPGTTWLVLDREEGDQGAAQSLAHTGVRTVCLSDLLLGDTSHRPTSISVGQRPTALAARLAADPAAPIGSLLDVPDLIAVEEYPKQPFDGRKLDELAGIHSGERAVIIGNGPSLRETDLKLLKDEITFGVNGIFYARQDMGFDPTYYVVEDSSVMSENLPAIRAQHARLKFFPSMYRDLYGADDAVYFNLNRGFYEQRSPNKGVPRFSVDAARRLYAGQSVTYLNLQLAYHMGFTTVLLVGVDFDYVIPADAERHGEILTSRGPDPNHFHPEYFGRGKTWKDPHLDRVAVNYELAREMFEADGRAILNATVGGKLEIFPRVDLDTMLA